MLVDDLGHIRHRHRLDHRKQESLEQQREARARPRPRRQPAHPALAGNPRDRSLQRRRAEVRDAAIALLTSWTPHIPRPAGRTGEQAAPRESRCADRAVSGEVELGSQHDPRGPAPLEKLSVSISPNYVITSIPQSTKTTGCAFYPHKTAMSPLWELLIDIILRIRVNAFTACSALLLFHGTPSCSRNVNNFPRFFSSRFFSGEAASVTQVMQETGSKNLSADRLLT